MASVASRKKSIIETPVANNTLLNKSASQSTSLYQQCSSLRARLMRIRSFPAYFHLASADDSRQSTDPVTQLWDLFSLGIPLCFLFNLLPPPVAPIKIDTDPVKFDIDDGRAKKRAIALFAMQIRQVEQCEQFTVTDLWDRNSTDGLVKVINTVTIIVDRLPDDLFEAPSPPPSLAAHESTDSLGDLGTIMVPANAQETARINIIREMVETERKYVQDLEVMQKYSNALSQHNIMAQDEIHFLFPNLNKLLNFQRRFLIRLESTAELPWQEQRWGLHFLESEEEFVVYEPYCANYTNAADMMLANELNLMTLNGLINCRSELPAFLIKPVQRICKYPLLLDSLIKASKPPEYPYYEELKDGSAAAKRITDKINEAQRRADNEQTVKQLEGRIEDWKGHHLSHFGELLLDDVFLVKKSGVDREYHVFLFEKIILCCKEALLQSATASKKAGKNGSLLKKPPSTVALNSQSAPQKKNTPLLLKGRIFLNNVTRTVPISPRNSPSGAVASLEVWWRGDDDLEFFTLRCRTEEQMKQWETQINRLIQETQARRAVVDRGFPKAMTMANNIQPPLGRHLIRSHDRNTSNHSVYLGPQIVPYTVPGPGEISPYGSEENLVAHHHGGPYGGPQGYPSVDGFEFDEEEFDEPASAISYTASGRGTPLGARRNNAMSMPPERDAIPGYDRPRAQTEDTNGFVMAQWRSNQGKMPPPLPQSAGVHNSAHRPITPRLISASSVSSFSSDASYVGTTRPSSRAGQLRTQFSSSKLRSGYDSGEARAKAPLTIPANPYPPPNRVRSASQPSTYHAHKQQQQAPPLPSAPWVSNGSTSTSKRGSGSSQSTGGSSEYSPNSSSPVTPFGSSESSLAAVGVRPSRSQNFESAVNAANQMPFSPPVKVKVHFHEDIFVIQVPRATDYADLVEKVGKKIRLCGPRREDGPLRVKYRDEDGDMVSLGSTEDVQMAFESYKPGGQVTLFVT